MRDSFQLPSEIDCRQTMQGVRYVFPRRNNPRGVGVVLALFGAAFAGFAVCFMAVVLSITLGEGGVEILAGVCMSLFAVPFLAIGAAILGFGLNILAGHSVVEVRGPTLVAADGFGPFKWRRKREASAISHLAVIPSGTRLSGMCALDVQCTGNKSMQCARGYPDDWLRAVAADLSDRLNVATAEGSAGEATPAALAHAETVLPAHHGDGARRREVTLAHDRTSGGLLALLIFAVIWNGISWGIGSVIFFTGDDNTPLFAKLIVGLFMLIGLAIVAGAIKMALARSKLHPPQVTLSVQPLRVGEPFSGRFLQQAKGRARIDRVKLQLICRERATYRRGTNTHTATHDAYTEEVSLAESTDANSVQPIEGEFQFQIPDDAMHSFSASRNKIQWLVTTTTEVAGWPDYSATFEVSVAARRHQDAARPQERS